MDNFVVFLIRNMIFTLNFFQACPTPTLEVGVLEHVPLATLHLHEPVDVQLPHERRKIAMLEIFGQNRVSQFVDVEDFKPILAFNPFDDVPGFFILYRSINTSKISNNLEMKTDVDVSD